MSEPDPDAAPTTSPTRRRGLVVLAGHTGDRAGAVAGLSDADPAVREAAIGAVSRLGCWDEPALRTVLADPVARVRRRAALAAARTTLAADALVGLLGDDDPAVVEVAAFAVGEREDADAGAVEALARVGTDHDDHLCREAAVAALGSVVATRGDDLDPGAHGRALTAVLAGTRDRANVRRRAVLALAAFDDDEASEALRRLAGDRDLQVRQAAEDLLAIEEGEEVGPGDDGTDKEPRV